MRPQAHAHAGAIIMIGNSQVENCNEKPLSGYMTTSGRLTGEKGHVQEKLVALGMHSDAALFMIESGFVFRSIAEQRGYLDGYKGS